MFMLRNVGEENKHTPKISTLQKYGYNRY